MEFSRSAVILMIAFVLILFGTKLSVFEVYGRDLGALLPASTAFGKVIDKVSADNSKKRDSIVFVGDIMLARDVERKIATYGQEYPYLGSDDLFNSKFVVANFEAAIPSLHQPTPDFGMKFSVTTDNLQGLVKSGVTHLSLANNHALDQGPEGYSNTTYQLQLRGFTVAGHPSIISSDSISYLELARKEIAIINLNASFGYPSFEQLLPVLEEAKEASDIQIVYIHWGDEYEVFHSASQQAFAHELIDAGVDLIVGHHPHVVQDVEFYNGFPIFYSLGNYIFDQYFSPEVQVGLALELIPDSNGWSIELRPVESYTSKAAPREMTSEGCNSFLSSLAELSSDTWREQIKSGSLSLQFDSR